MTTRMPALQLAICSLMATLIAGHTLLACCAVSPSGKPVVNADQTVILIWDPATKTQHFIRQASFKSDADDFGFIIPSPAQPQLDESGNEAFAVLRKLTEPEIRKVAQSRGSGCSCSSQSRFAMVGSAIPKVEVLEQKQVAGFDAVVLEAESADALVGWLKDHGYAFSPEVAAWAKPYVEMKWKFTALKVAKTNGAQPAKSVDAAALRLSFKTDRPIFPYREPDSSKFASALGAQSRLLRIYFVSDGRFEGTIGDERPWNATTAWSGPVSEADRTRTLEMLKLPPTTGPIQWRLTEFEHNWPYALAASDVFFRRSTDQNAIQRPPIIQYVAAPLPADGAAYALAGAMILLPLVRKFRRRKSRKSS